MRGILVTIALAAGLGVAAQAGTVYRWVDEDGRVHYSDSPRPGAEAVELRQPNVYEAPKNLPKIQSGSRSPEAGPAGYDRLAITYPEPDTAFWDNQGNFSLRLSLEPELNTTAGHRIRISLDDKVQGTTQNLQWQFTGVDRGTHSVRAEVVDGDGNTLISSDPVSFHLHQQSINLPARRANP